jgi:hypothetical protein
MQCVSGMQNLYEKKKVCIWGAFVSHARSDSCAMSHKYVPVASPSHSPSCCVLSGGMMSRKSSRRAANILRVEEYLLLGYDAV